MVKPVLFFPYHDPDLKYAPALLKSLPELLDLFAAVCLGITPATVKHTSLLADLDSSGAISLRYPVETSIGQHQSLGLSFAALNCKPGGRVLYTFVDRLLATLGSLHRQSFINDISLVSDAGLTIYSRSDAAWATHPPVYRGLENMVTELGVARLGLKLDWTWCAAMFTKQSAGMLARLAKCQDFGVLAEFIVIARKLGVQVEGLDVDWLEWEDPFWDKTASADTILSSQEMQFWINYCLSAAAQFKV